MERVTVSDTLASESLDRQHSRIEGLRRPVRVASAAAMVASWADRTPTAAAIIHGKLTVTYAEFRERALRVTERLQELGIGPGDRVALWADRTPAVLYAAMGAWLAGAAYVPIDPTYPTDRVGTILDLADPALLVFDGDADSKAPPDTANSVDIAAALAARAANVRPSLPGAGDAAYIIFTSGSSGVPKGVVVEHRSLANYVAWFGDMAAGTGSGAPLFGSMAFDHTVTSWWVPLAHGKPVAIVGGSWDQARLFAPRSERWSFMKVTPSHARLFEKTSRPHYGAFTERLVFGGEMLRPELLEQLAGRLDGVRLINHYGPTEATVGCCWNAFELNEVRDQRSVPIGRPVWNTRVYLVDENLYPVKPGEPGHFVIAGAPVARGYLHGDSRSFIDESELNRGDGCARAYLTGDVAELLPQGTLTFLGRVDDQLNVGRHRIEREELRRHAVVVPGIVDVAFDVVDEGVEIVRAMVVAESGVNGDELGQAVRRAMGKALPAAVVPKIVDVVDRLTVNTRGKLELSAATRD